jgi:hypothetical protein
LEIYLLKPVTLVQGEGVATYFFVAMVTIAEVGTGEKTTES